MSPAFSPALASRRIPSNRPLFSPRTAQMAFQRPTYDCVLIGGGVIGLSLAWELARNRMRVCVLERDEPGRGASWAGAGILPPGADASHAEPLQRLLAQSSRLHEAWAGRLREETDIDTGFRKCGAF